MNWKEAVKYMEEGGYIKRKGWHIDDYIFIDNGILKDDGGNCFLPRLSSTSGSWIKKLNPSGILRG